MGGEVNSQIRMGNGDVDGEVPALSLLCIGLNQGQVSLPLDSPLIRGPG